MYRFWFVYMIPMVWESGERSPMGWPRISLAMIERRMSLRNWARMLELLLDFFLETEPSWIWESVTDSVGRRRRVGSTGWAEATVWRLVWRLG